MKVKYENRKYNRDEDIFVFKQYDMNYHAHWHHEVELLYVINGSVRVGINSEEVLLTENQILICAGDDIHYYNSDSLTSESILIIFDESILSNFLSWSQNAKIVSEVLDFSKCSDEGKPLIDIMNKIIEEDKIKSALYKDVIRANVYNLMIEMFRRFPDYYALTKNNSKKNSNNATMKKALQYIDDNFDTEISLKSLANSIGLSEYYFSRLFKETTGLNFNVYLSFIRIENAKKLIKTTDKSMIEISCECGFVSIRTFNRNFIRFCNVTPSEYRRSIESL